MNLPPRFPAVTFLLGASGVGKTRLADQMSMSYASVSRLSIRAPLHEAMLQTFWPDSPMISPAPDDHLPNSSTRTVSGFLYAYEKFLLQYLGDHILGEIVRSRAADAFEFFPHIIIDDAKSRLDWEPLLAELPPADCMFVVLLRPGFAANPPNTPEGVPYLLVRNEGPDNLWSQCFLNAYLTKDTGNAQEIPKPILEDSRRTDDSDRPPAEP